MALLRDYTSTALRQRGPLWSSRGVARVVGSIPGPAAPYPAMTTLIQTDEVGSLGNPVLDTGLAVWPLAVNRIVGEGLTAGTTGASIGGDIGAEKIAATFQTPELQLSEWPAGDWNIRLNVTTPSAAGNTNWRSTFFHRVTRTGTLVQRLKHVIDEQALDTATTFEVNASLPTSNGSLSDVMLITLTMNVLQIPPVTIVFLPGEPISTPLNRRGSLNPRGTVRTAGSVKHTARTAGIELHTARNPGAVASRVSIGGVSCQRAAAPGPLTGKVSF